MKIQFGDYYKIESDERQYVIYSRSDREPDEKNKERFTAWGNAKHYSMMENAFARLLELMADSPEVESVEKLLESIRNAKEDIIRALHR